MIEIRKRVNLKVGKAQVQAEIVSFNGLESGEEHIAMYFSAGENTTQPPLVRIHSECLTGDVFGSSRCDCGEQLEEAINLLGRKGGVLLYMRQEGRGIGLYNKIDAYELQDTGLNTYEANLKLGFAEDLRNFDEAAEMLKALGLSEVQLMTNNPLKISQLEKNGITVSSVLNTSVYLKPENALYLKAKKLSGNHQIILR